MLQRAVPSSPPKQTVLGASWDQGLPGQHVPSPPFEPLQTSRVSFQVFPFALLKAQEDKSDHEISRLKVVAPVVSVIKEYSGHRFCVFLKRVCNVALLDCCLSTGFILNLFFFSLNGVTSFICGVLRHGLLFKEALNTWNVLLFLACLADLGKAFSSLIVINCMSETVNITHRWCFWVAVNHTKILYVLDENAAFNN